MSLAVDILGSGLLFCLVFGMSATVDMRNMEKQIKNKYAIMTGVFLQFVLLPFLGFAVVRALKMSHAMGLTLLVVTSSPGGSYSNWWCSMFNADLALSVTMTAISTLLSTAMLPINLLIYTSFSYDADVVKSLDWVALFIALGVVIGAICLGLYASATVHSHRFNRMANRLGNLSGVGLVLFSATMSNTGGDAKLWNHGWVFYVGVAAPCVLGLVIANILSSFLRLKKPERVTVSVECCYQNVGIATSVALTMFNGNDRSEAMAVPFYYGIVEAVVVGLYCVLAWKAGWTKAPKDVSIFKVIATSYEVVDAEQHELREIEISLSEGDDAEKTCATGSTIFHYFTMDNPCADCTGKVGSFCLRPDGGCCDAICGGRDDDEYYENAEEELIARHLKPKQPSGYTGIVVNHPDDSDEDSVDDEPSSALALAMQGRWRWHRRTRSEEIHDLGIDSMESQSSGIAKPAGVQRAVTAPSAAKVTCVQRAVTAAPAVARPAGIERASTAPTADKPASIPRTVAAMPAIAKPTGIERACTAPTASHSTRVEREVAIPATDQAAGIKRADTEPTIALPERAATATATVQATDVQSAPVTAPDPDRPAVVDSEVTAPATTLPTVVEEAAVTVTGGAQSADVESPVTAPAVAPPPFVEREITAPAADSMRGQPFDSPPMPVRFEETSASAHTDVEKDTEEDETVSEGAQTRLDADDKDDVCADVQAVQDAATSSSAAATSLCTEEKPLQSVEDSESTGSAPGGVAGLGGGDEEEGVHVLEDKYTEDGYGGIAS